MSHTVIEMNCPGCGARVSAGQRECEWCHQPIVISTFNSVYAMPMPQVNKYAGEYKKALAESPEDKELNNSIAMCYLKLKLYDKALPAFEKAMDEDFGNSETFFYAAVCLLNGKKAFLAQRADIDKIKPYIDESLSEYGLKCVSFALAGLDIDVAKYDVIDDSQIELIASQRGYQGDKSGTHILGDDWGRVQGAKTLKDLANNPGAGGVAAAGAGMGVGIGAAGVFSSIAQQVFAPAQNGFAPQQPANPLQNAPSGRFTQKSAVSAVPVGNAEDPVEILGKLKKLLDAGLIEQTEYDAKKAEILSRM